MSKSTAERGYEHSIGNPNGTTERADTGMVSNWLRSRPGFKTVALAAGVVIAMAAGACNPKSSTYDPEGDDDTAVSDDDTAGDDDTEAVGDDDTAAGDDDAAAGDDDTAAGDDDTAAGDDDTAAGDDDTAAGDDDTAEEPPDSDGDGFPDSTDTCRYTVDFEEGDTGTPQNTDGDALANSCDPCPANAPAAGRAADEDVDEDGVGTACDIDDNYYNPGQGDGDHDGAPDGRDNCDGHYNAPDTTGNQLDGDNDGVGIPCDCDDENDSVHPGATDTPGDGADSDCDDIGGVVGAVNPDRTWVLAGEPGYACQVGATRPYGISTGDCEEGVETCMAVTGGSIFLPTTSSVDARPQTCGDVGADDDCDGLTAADDPDADCECVGTETQDCEAVRAPCVAGTKTCDNGRYGPCEGAVGPEDEVCNRIDDNCDGTIDNREGSACVCANGEVADVGTDEGPCTKGEKECVDGDWVVTTEPTGGEDELPCDGRDNDCDGVVDNGFGLGDACGKGACAGGVKVCNPSNPAVPMCSTDNLIREEVCDTAEKDEDCDDKINEGDTASEDGYPIVGSSGSKGEVKHECELPCGAPGVYGCAADHAVICKPILVDGFDPVGTIDRDGNDDEKNCDGRDSDCDDLIDEGCGCSDGETRGCTVTEGACTATGVQNCEGGEFESGCSVTISVTDEICGNRRDDDCDGEIDDFGSYALGETCDDSELLGQCGMDPTTGVPLSGTYECDGTDGLSCTAQDRATTEQCDFDALGRPLDNNCDGDANEGEYTVVGEPTRTAQFGESCVLPGDCGGRSQYTCDEGGESVVCASAVNATEPDGVDYLGDHDETIFDGRDGDCDGTRDDGLNGVCDFGEEQACGTTNTGACDFGTQECVVGDDGEGEWGPCVGAVPPAQEDCVEKITSTDADDKDCDGNPYNGFTNPDTGAAHGTADVGTGECGTNLPSTPNHDGVGKNICNPNDPYAPLVLDVNLSATTTNPRGRKGTEICDDANKDEDCDGLGNEGKWPTLGETCILPDGTDGSIQCNPADLDRDGAEAIDCLPN